MKALSNLRVIDLSQGVAGPHAGMLLAQHGADVVKVEPLEGDWGRTLGKQYGSFCAHAIVFNRGKRSIAVDLKSDEGRRIVVDLIARADIVLESYRPGVLKRLGLSYEDVRVIKPDIIYLSITGFGQTGPGSGLPATDSIIQANSGWMTLHRDENGRPMRSGIIAIDVMTGLYAFQAIAMALIARMRTGEGTYIDCSMLQSAAAFQAAKILENYLEDGQPVVSYVPVGVMETSDGYVTISAMRDAHYDALCGILGREDLARDERFNGRDKRRANKALLMPILEDEFRKKTSSEWCEALTRAGVMNARINTYLEFLAEPQVEHAGIVAMVDHGHLGVAPAVNIPGTPALGDDPAAHRCPDIGEDGDRILAELGRSRTDIQRLRTAGAVR